MAGIGTFPARLNVSIFLLHKGADGKITLDSPSYGFTFLNNGSEEWSDDSIWEALREHTRAHMHSWIGPKGGELLLTQWFAGNVRLRWRHVAKRFRLIVTLRPPLL